MKKIVFMGIAILLAIGMVVGGTLAYFSDVETTTDNVIQAGTIDLAVNNENPWTTAAFTFLDIKPCLDLEPFDFTLVNVGNNEGILFTSMSVDEDDKFWEGEYSGPDWNMTAEEFARLVYVSAVEYQYSNPDDNYFGGWHDDLTEWLLMDLYVGNNDGYLSLYEITAMGQIPYDSINDPFPANAIITYRITFHLAHAFYYGIENQGNPYTGLMSGYTGDYWLYTIPVMWNVPQADGISLTITGYLYQVGYPAP